jgi:hypothetical protein
MSAGAGRAEHDPLEVGVLQLFNAALSNILLRTATQAPEDRVPISEALRQVAPWPSVAVDLQHRIDKLTIVTGGNAAVVRLSQKQVFNPSKLLLSDFVSCHSNWTLQEGVFAGVCSTTQSKPIAHTL